MHNVVIIVFAEAVYMKILRFPLFKCIYSEFFNGSDRSNNRKDKDKRVKREQF